MGLHPRLTAIVLSCQHIPNAMTGPFSQTCEYNRGYASQSIPMATTIDVSAHPTRGCEMEGEVVGIDSRISAPLKVHSYWYITPA